MKQIHAVTGVFIDLETGGLDATRDALIEVGAVAFEIRAHTVSIFDVFQQLVIPAPRLAVCADALRIQGRDYGDMNGIAVGLGGALVEAVAFDRFNAWLTSAFNAANPAYWNLWAHNAAFENAFLHQWQQRVLGKPTKEYEDYFPARGRAVCTKTLADVLRMTGHIDAPSSSLQNLRTHYGIEFDGPAHRALADAEMGARVLQRLLLDAGMLTGATK